MAKRFNIIRNIKEEMKKGNNYVASNGNFVSGEMLHTEILNSFKRELSADPEKMCAIPFDQYKEKALSEYTSAQEVLDGICEAFHLVDNVATEESEKATQNETSIVSDGDLNPPTTEQEKPSPKPKKTAKRKCGDTE